MIIKPEHDYRTNKSEKGVELIVRRNNRYGISGEGEHILVDACELRNQSTVSSCMTAEEEKKLEAARKKVEADKQEKKSLSSATKRVIDEGLQRISENGIAAAKEKALKETLEAEQLDRQAEAREIAAE